MAAFAVHNEVRVTRRKSMKADFIAPDLSPVRRVDQELDKGLKGWTDFDNKIEDNALVDGGKQRAAVAELEAMKAGTPIRKPRPVRYVVKGSRYGI